MTFFPLLLICWGLIGNQNTLQLCFFEAFDTFEHASAKDLTKLSGKYDLRKNSLFMLKMKDIIDVLSLTKPFQGSCFGHAFSKASQYALVDEKICKGLKYISIKTAQFDLHKCITWPKKSRKGKQEWNKACAYSNFPQKK
jgi:hypothetical protein